MPAAPPPGCGRSPAGMLASPGQSSRIFIWGNGGAGKTTLLARLGTVLDLPAYSVDDFRWAPGWVERSKEQVGRELARIVEADRWIIEDGSVRWVSLLAARAQTVLWLDPPTGGCLLRTMRRSFGRAFMGTHDGRGPEHLVNDSLRHWRWICRYRRTRRDAFLKALADHRKVVRIGSWRDVKRLPALLGAPDGRGAS